MNRLSAGRDRGRVSMLAGGTAAAGVRPEALATAQGAIPAGMPRDLPSRLPYAQLLTLLG